MKTKQFFIGSLFLMVVAVVITAVFITPSTYAATTITVTTTTDVLDGSDGLCSLREAVYAANNNVQFGGVAGECPAGTDADTDIITLADGATYILSIAGVDEDNAATGDLDILDNTATLDVQFVVSNNGNATIDADSIDRVLHIEDAAVELNQITFVNGSTSLSSDKIGGGVLNRNGILTMNQGAIQAGSAVIGGGIYNYSSSLTGGKVTLNGTHIILNTAGVVGGIISNGDNALIALNGAVVRANSSNNVGGGLGIFGGELLVEDSTISLNDAQSHGGGIYAEGGSAIAIINSLIEANEATGVDVDGGGIYLADNDTQADTMIQNSTIKDNIATDDGGGLIGPFDPPYTSIITIQDSDFIGNQAAAGGAMIVSRASISGGIYDNNHATSGGAGAIFAGSLIITDTVFTNNTATDSAGAIFGQRLTATNIHVENNHSGTTGGGLYLLGNAPENISGSVIISNTATSGAGIYIWSNGSGHLMSILETAVANNHATSEGGGIWTSNENLFISNSTISSNRADSSGGGLYIDATGTITATNVTIALNTPGQDIYKVGELTLQNSIIHTPETPNCTFIATPIISLGNNLADDASCGGLTQPSDEINADVLLAPLADNGGNTLTHDLLDGSPAIDTGNAAACAASPINNVDQRGTPRIIGSSCDKGAVERGSVVFLPVILK